MGGADADLVEVAVVAEGDFAVVVDAVVSDPVLDGGVGGGPNFGEPGVGGGGGDAAERAVRASVVVFVGKLVEEPLETVEGDGG